LRQNPSDGPEFDYRQAVGFHLTFDMMTLGIASFLAARFTGGAISLVTQKSGLTFADVGYRQRYGSTDALEACPMADRINRLRS
jgi:hypothetical protein